MLEIRNVTKIYKSKAGNSVTALDNLSMTFPETGMVFVLGKSGSGKSTLLNVIGGLDGYDSGEFIIKGKSSKDFAGSDFDAYRNTFIGFIFQEYNILDDFTVGANIGLALELQGKKATNEKISEILAQVDMLDYAKRKPNELSGGQKQRIAIARALVKDPEIIMADEPTGALDSNTGKQIFDTLKELSKTKLVIVVSHDRDFAEKYGDRIIEMMDGRILTDVTKHQVEAQALSSGILKMNDNLLRIEQGYQLTAKDVELINEYLRSQSSEILISGDQRLNSNVRSTAGISEDNTSSVFADTDAKKDIVVKDYSGTKTKFIRSRLPMKNALKIGGSSLGHKKFRLVMTILLSMIAFALFGFADSLGSYNKIVAATDSIMDSHIQNASFSLGVKHTYVSSDGDEDVSYYSAAMNEEDLAILAEKTGLTFVPVFNGSQQPEHTSISLMNAMISTNQISTESAYTGTLSGFAAIDEAQMAQFGLSVWGKMPTSENEIAISKLMVEQFNLTGFQNQKKGESIKAGSVTYEDNGSGNSIIGKHLNLNLNGYEYMLKITGVIDTQFEYDRYRDFIPTESESNQQSASQSSEELDLVQMILQKELQNTLRYGFHCLGYVTQERLDVMSERIQTYGKEATLGTYMQWNLGLYSPNNAQQPLLHLNRVADSSALSSFDRINWIDGVERATLGENEMVISQTIFNQLLMSHNVTDRVEELLAQEFGSNWKSEYNMVSGGKAHQLSDVINALSQKNGNFAESHKKIISELLKIEFSDNLPPEFYHSVSVVQMSENDEWMLHLHEVQSFLIWQYVYESVWGNEELYLSDEFFDSAVTLMTSRESWDKLSDDDKQRLAIDAYSQLIYHTQNDKVNPFGQSYSDLVSEAQGIYLKATNASLDDLFDGIYLEIQTYRNGSEQKQRYTDYKIVGFFNPGASYETQHLVISDTLYDMYEEYRIENKIGKEIAAPHTPGIYAFAISSMPKDADAIRKLVELSYDENNDLQFSLRNQVMDTLGSFNEFIEMGAKIFLYIGLGFALFSALMLMNFISVSISYKRREIGILRAVGARSSDVFKIFFCEAFIIALINCILAIAATITTTTVFNNIVRNEGLNVTLLHFGIRQVILMLLISIAVAAIASFLPVWNIARRKPVDAIKNK